MYLQFENVNILVSALYSNHALNDNLYTILISSQKRDNVAYRVHCVPKHILQHTSYQLPTCCFFNNFKWRENIDENKTLN